MTIQDEIHLVSTLLTVGAHADYGYGTGFFYARLKEPGTSTWENVESMWLVTNRHVALLVDDEDALEPIESLPEAILFWHRETIKNHIVISDYAIERKELRQRLFVHRNRGIDLAIIRVDDLIYQRHHEKESGGGRGQKGPL